MKKTINLLSLAFIATIILSACSSKNDDKKAETTADGSQTTTSEPSKPHKYPFEKGIIYQKVTAVGMDMPTTVYVDKWGEWEATEMTMEIMGQKSHTLKIVKGNDVWDIDMEKKTGQHYTQSAMTGYQGLDLENLDMSKLTDEAKKMIERLRIEFTGEEEYLGYKCKKMVMKGKDMQVNMEMLMCGNMTMKMKGKAMGFETSMEVTKIDKTAPPADKFEVPAGVTMADGK